MKYLVFLIALLPAFANSALLTHETDGVIFQLGGGLDDTTSYKCLYSWTLDTETFAITALTFESEMYSGSMIGTGKWELHGPTPSFESLYASVIGRFEVAFSIFAGEPSDLTAKGWLEFENITKDEFHWLPGVATYLNVNLDGAMIKAEGSGRTTYTHIASVPEPSALALLGLGLAGLVRFRRKQMPNLV
jgi:hypothetical protein